MNLDQLYETKKETISLGRVQLMVDKMDYVETNLRFMLDEFNSFHTIKLNFRPEHPTSVKVIFFTRPDRKLVHALIGVNLTEAQAKRSVLDEPDD